MLKSTISYSVTLCTFYSLNSSESCFLFICRYALATLTRRREKKPKKSYRKNMEKTTSCLHNVTSHTRNNFAVGNITPKPLGR